MFHQLLTPVTGSLALSDFVAALPVVAVALLLGVLRRPAWQAALVGLILGLVTQLKGQEGEIFARTFVHSIGLTVVLVVLVVVQQYLIPGIVPHTGGAP